jgi:hypothetical protein
MDPIRRRLVRIARGGLTAVSAEPPGAVARPGLAGRAGYEPLRAWNATTDSSRRYLVKPLDEVGVFVG